jgi:hypothetical protein
MNPYEVAEEIAALLKSYRCARVVGDSYGAKWVSEAFVKAGIAYRKSEMDRSAIYLNALPLFTSGRARLIDNPRLIAQLAALERRTFSTDRDRVDHGRTGRDDDANSAADALVLAAQAQRKVPIAPPTLFSVKTGEVLVGPQAHPAGSVRSHREIATSPCAPPVGGNFKPPRSEPWYPFVSGGRDRWSPDW